MKKFFIFSLVCCCFLLFSSCEKDERHSYSIYNHTDYEINYMVKEYDKNNTCVATNSGILRAGFSESYNIAQPKATHLTVRISTGSYIGWLSQVYYLTESYTSVDIYPSSVVTDYEPSY